MGSQVRIVRQTRLDPAFPLSRRELVGVVACILEALGLEGGGLEITLVDDSEMARLNAGFMGCPGPTNVLSFPVGDGSRAGDGSADDSAYLGELALCVDALAREAQLYGQSEAGHLARLLAHGILHLAGYDHGPEMDDLTELAVERVLLAQAD